MKTCSRCGEEKPRSAYYKDKRAKDGLYSCCKDCFKRASREAYAKDPEKKLAWQREYQRRHPERRKAARDKWARKNPESNKERRRAFRERHPERITAYNVKYYAENREAELERAAKYREENREAIYARRDSEKHQEYGRKRRALQLDAYVAEVVFADIVQRDLGICGICGEPADGPVELDHIIPLSRGGTHEPDNVQLAHRLCNRKKWARTS